jgi:hypothetical protein
MLGKSWRLAASLAAICGALAGSQAWAQTADRLALEVLSSRPQLVSGGDALVKISGAHGAPAVTIDGKDVSGAFKPDSKGGWVGLVDGLKDGDNRLVAKADGNEAVLTLKNHPLNGTLFADRFNAVPVRARTMVWRRPRMPPARHRAPSNITTGTRAANGNRSTPRQRHARPMWP